MLAVQVLAFFISTVVANNCSITPIYIDFHDRRVNNGTSFQYGLFVGAGTPSQNQSLWPALAQNETTFADINYCAEGTTPNCFDRSHGFYEPQKSRTFREDNNYESLDLSALEDVGIVTVGTDTVNIFTHYYDPSPPNVTHVTNFPVTVLSNYSSSRSPWFGPAEQFGLGPSSTVLRRLYDLNRISSRSFGLYIGTYYERAAGFINGSLTLGGYDSGRFTGDLHQHQIHHPVTPAETPYQVQVSRMTLTTANGESTDLADSNFQAYLTTAQFPLTLPRSTTQNFIDLTSAVPSKNDDNSLALPAGFNGTLTITLSTGLIVNLSSEELRNVSNVSPISAPSNNNSTPGPFLLGTSFLAHTYLITNYDSTPPEFFLANALPHAPYIFPEVLCPNTMPFAYQRMHIPSFNRNGIPGAIVGGIIGGIGLTILIWWSIFKIQQKKRQRVLDNIEAGKRKWSGTDGDGDSATTNAGVVGRIGGGAKGDSVGMQELRPTGMAKYRDDDNDYRGGEGRSTSPQSQQRHGSPRDTTTEFVTSSHERYADVPITPATPTNKETGIETRELSGRKGVEEGVSWTRNSSVSSM